MYYSSLFSLTFKKLFFLVDCTRSTTILPTTTDPVPSTTTTAIKTTILVKKPKLFVVTSNF